MPGKIREIAERERRALLALSALLSPGKTRSDLIFYRKRLDVSGQRRAGNGRRCIQKRVYSISKSRSRRVRKNSRQWAVNYRTKHRKRRRLRHASVSKRLLFRSKKERFRGSAAASMIQGMMLISDIIPSSACGRIWQCAIHRPGYAGRNFTRTISPIRKLMVSSMS